LADVPPEAVYPGFSMGDRSAQKLVQTCSPTAASRSTTPPRPTSP